METLEQIKARAEAAVPGAILGILLNSSPSAQHSMVVDNEHALAVAGFLRDDPQLRLDYLSNATGVDWLDREVKESNISRQMVDGVERDIEVTSVRVVPGYLEAVYHL